MDNKKLVEHLLSRLALCETNLRDFCVEASPLFNKLVEIKPENLPTLINDTPPLDKWSSIRLKNGTKEEWDTPECWVEFLSEVCLSFEEYRGLGINDGELQSLAGIFNILGMEDEAQRAFSCMYDE